MPPSISESAVRYFASALFRPPFMRFDTKIIRSASLNAFIAVALSMSFALSPGVSTYVSPSTVSSSIAAVVGTSPTWKCSLSVSAFSRELFPELYTPAQVTRNDFPWLRLRSSISLSSSDVIFFDCSLDISPSDSRLFSVLRSSSPLPVLLMLIFNIMILLFSSFGIRSPQNTDIPGHILIF